MVFYFSGTGNTEWAARRLAESLGEPLVQMNEKTLVDVFTLAEGERIGFCFPVHGWQPPAFVQRFVRQMNFSEDVTGHYCYALCTCGDNIGQTMNILDQMLATQGMATDSVFSLVMPESYVVLPFMYTDTPKREKEKLAVAERELDRIIKDVTERRKGLDRTRRGPLPWVLTHVIGAVFCRWMITDKPFSVDTARCTACGRCVQVCPMYNISRGEGGRPVWGRSGGCTACLACYHHCPRHAINYGPLTHRRGQYYYGHPVLSTNQSKESKL